MLRHISAPGADFIRAAVALAPQDLPKSLTSISLWNCQIDVKPDWAPKGAVFARSTRPGAFEIVSAWLGIP
jgi:hypothetical protein